MMNQQSRKKAESSTRNKRAAAMKSTALMERVGPVPKRFFIVAQEGISLLWLDNGSKGFRRPTHTSK
jgi:hypothetical protein